MDRYFKLFEKMKVSLLKEKRKGMTYKRGRGIEKSGERAPKETLGTLLPAPAAQSTLYNLRAGTYLLPVVNFKKGL